jgi:UDP-N-acetylglucosamine diphosphorylase/glucosamine-1-phosphate N-acetyltransferase
MNNTASLIFFEDRQVDNFYPLSLSHTTAELRCGIFTLAEKWSQRLAPKDIYHLTRPWLGDFVGENAGVRTKIEELQGSTTILINPRFLPKTEVLGELAEREPQFAISSGDIPVALKLSTDSPEMQSILLAARDSDENSLIAKIEEVVASLPTVAIEQQPLDYLWDLVHQNGAQIIEDFEFLRQNRRTLQQSIPDSDCLIYSWDDIYLSPGARVDGQVVLDGRDGPIYVGSGCKIAAHTRVEGPAAIGAGSQLVGGRIRSGCTFGPHCRVGGEVEELIFHGFSNKYHDGFVGHAYLGEWVNLGALTTNSDLKNNYAPIKVELPSGVINTGQTKVGSFIGDHAKTGIGTLLTTGMVLGFAVNLFGGGLAPQRFLPGFLWGGRDGFVDYDLNKAIATAEVVLSRRDRELGKAARELFARVFAAEVALRTRITSSGQ